MRPGGVVQYTWEDVEYLIMYCGADIEDFITIEVEDEEDNEVQSV
jgi:hypothetical protein